MSHLPSPSALSAVRVGVGALAVALLGVLAWPVGDLSADGYGRGVNPSGGQGQAPPKQKRAEEEEDTKPGKAPGNKKRAEEEEPAKPARTPPGKKRRVEEEEEAATRPAKRKVVRVEEEEGKAKSSRQAGSRSRRTTAATRCTRPATARVSR